MSTIRLTAAEALVHDLASQYGEFDGAEVPLLFLPGDVFRPVSRYSDWVARPGQLMSTRPEVQSARADHEAAIRAPDGLT